MPTSPDLRQLLRYPVDFEAADDPNDSRFVFQTPDGEHRATASESIGALSQGIRALSADASVRAWAAPALVALRMMARGNLASPDTSELMQLERATTSIPGNAGEAQRKVNAFLKALAVDAPLAATTPQRNSYVAPRVAPHETKKTFKFALSVEFDDEAAGNLIATVALSIRQLDSSWGSVRTSELWTRDNHYFGESGKESTTKMLAQIQSVWPPASRLLADTTNDAVQVTADELALLGDHDVMTTLIVNRVEIQWPEDLVRELTAKPVVSRIEAPGSDRPKAFASDQLFTFDWSVALGDSTLTQQELDELTESQHGLLLLRDQWVFIDPAKLMRIRERASRMVTPAEALRVAASGTLVVDGLATAVDTVGWLEDLRLRLAVQDRDIVPAVQPPELAGQLRDYQLQGLRWMTQLVDLGLGGVLADDMGLGKTVMLIALHLHRTTETTGPTLVVCPASVLGNWEREIIRFAPGTHVRRYHGAGRSLDGVKDGFVLTTYATMRADSEALAAHESGWGLVVADEAQNVKNPRSRTSQALRGIRAETRLALTGTPVENNLSELWAILDWTTPGLLGSHEEFRRQWSRPIEGHRDDARATQLSQLIRPFVLRRRKSDPGIAPELPPKIETDHSVHLTREQVGLYEAVVRDTLTQIRSSEGIRRRGLVVKLLTQLKQICNHPAQFLRQPTSRLTGRSGKFLVFDELVEEIVAEGGAILVFTQYAQMGRLIARHLAERKIGHMFLHGGTTVNNREVMVNRFQGGEVPVFILSLKAAGVGLNLTKADHVIHFDRWWNPAVEDQATDRAHRIGQTKPVQVHRLISAGTIEESIAELIASKRSLADAVVNGGEAALTELSDADLAALVRLRRD
ncbi:MAG: helicase [Nocardioidaceae bacterium]|nr:helicase [Nocardioidaceae bacterium]